MIHKSGRKFSPQKKKAITFFRKLKPLSIMTVIEFNNQSTIIKFGTKQDRWPNIRTTNPETSLVVFKKLNTIKILTN